VPFNVKVIGSVAVVPSGIAFVSLTVKNPAGSIPRKPSARFTDSVETTTLVVAIYGIPLVLVLMIVLKPFIFSDIEIRNR
jgi:hypothetical protein